MIRVAFVQAGLTVGGAERLVQALAERMDRGRNTTSLLNLYGPEGVRMFRNMLFADMIFPAVYGTLFFLIGALVAAGVVSVAGIAAACFDYLENIFLLVVLSRLPSRLTWVARIAGICTSLKLLSFVITLGALATALLGH